MMSINISFN